MKYQIPTSATKNYFFQIGLQSALVFCGRLTEVNDHGKIGMGENMELDLFTA